MGSSNMKKDCVSRMSPSVSSLSVVVSWQEGKMEAFEANPYHSFATKVT
jgi:hypothetical protein